MHSGPMPWPLTTRMVVGPFDEAVELMMVFYGRIRFVKIRIYV